MRLLAVLILSISIAAQEAPPVPAAQAPAQPAAETAENEVEKIVVPAGTKIPVVLKHAINTKSARVGDNVYAETNFPVAQDDRMLIPPGTYVQGRISAVKRPGRVKGRAELLLHFTSLIFPNGYTVAIPGALDNIPGADEQQVKDEEGTIQHGSQKGKDAATIGGTAATGTLIGAAAGGGKGAGIGAAAGGVGGLIISLLTRGSDVVLPAGTTVEMVLQRPLTLEEERLQASPRPLVPQRRKLGPQKLTPAPPEQ